VDEIVPLGAIVREKINNGDDRGTKQHKGIENA